MTILITGANGNVSGEVLRSLEGTADLRVLVRDRAKAPSGVEVAVGDLHHPETLDQAFEGVDTVWLLNAPGLHACQQQRTLGGQEGGRAAHRPHVGHRRGTRRTDPQRPSCTSCRTSNSRPRTSAGPSSARRTSCRTPSARSTATPSTVLPGRAGSA
ncbi:SDR family oxidoreductase [Streptosporangium lutulentum]